MLATQGILTYCANGRTTVPMYADAARLLVFGAFLTSAGCVKKYFFDATDKQVRFRTCLFHKFVHSFAEAVDGVLISGCHRIHHAVVDMVFEDYLAGVVQRRAHSGQLNQHL